MRRHPAANALHRHLFPRNQVALDEDASNRGKGITVMRVVADAQRRAVLEDHATRALDPDRERVEWILEPADFKLLAVKRARLAGAAVVVRHQLVVLVAPPNQRALVWNRVRSEPVAGNNEVTRAPVE